jgi:hypothetical protein
MTASAVVAVVAENHQVARWIAPPSDRAERSIDRAKRLTVPRTARTVSVGGEVAATETDQRQRRMFGGFQLGPGGQEAFVVLLGPRQIVRRAECVSKSGELVRADGDHGASVASERVDQRLGRRAPVLREIVGEREQPRLVAARKRRLQAEKRQLISTGFDLEGGAARGE